MGFFKDNGGALATQGIGMLYDQLTTGQQMDNQIELMGVQNQYEQNLMNQQMLNQATLNHQGHELQMDMWNKTNYGAQMEHMRKAGLNPALMYKSGGQAGQTGSQTGGNASKGNVGLGMAPKAPQFELYGAQAKLMEEQAKDIKSQRSKRDGVDTELTNEEIQNKAVDTELKDLKRKREKKGYIDGNNFATAMNVIGKDPVNNLEDREWLMNRVYGYFGIKLGTQVLSGILGAYRGLLMGKTNNKTSPGWKGFDTYGKYKDSSKPRMIGNNGLLGNTKME